MNPLEVFRDPLMAGDRLCVLPISRVLVEDPRAISPKMIIYPPAYLTAEMMKVVSYPKYEYNEICRRNGTPIEDGQRFVTAEGPELAWFQSAATNITAEQFFESATIAFTLPFDWDQLIGPETHEDHLALIRAAVRVADDTFDLIRFNYCLPWIPGTLPGRPGLLGKTGFTSALFYSLHDNESYVVAGELHGYQITTGIGLDMNGVGVVEPAPGEVGFIAQHGLRLYSLALEAPTETSKFTQLISVIEYLADPEKFIKMQEVKGQIARQIAADRAEYESIIEDFKYLTSEGGRISKDTKGLRHNIVHVGAQFEDLVPVSERIPVFKRLFWYAGVPLRQMLSRSTEPWDAIVQLRAEAGIRLGLNPKRPLENA